ncbi:MAG: DUF885 domain-containing protein [Caulobacterales bacterium]|nr:DUF885 domain-containing protein [Caulobacterales bacterium]
MSRALSVSGPVSFLRIAGMAAVTVLAGCVAGGSMPAFAADREGAPLNAEEGGAGALDRIADEIWRWRLERQPAIRVQLGLPIVSVPRATHDQAVSDGEGAKEFLNRLMDIDAEELDRERATTHAFLSDLLQSVTESADHFEHGFAITPYAMHVRAGAYHQYAPAAALTDEEERSGYLRFLSGYAQLIEDLYEKTELQSHKGAYLPRGALDGVRAYWTNLRGRTSGFSPGADRLPGLNDEAAAKYVAAAEHIIDSEIDAAYVRILSLLDETYEAAAPEAVGLHQYEGGRAHYEWLIKQYTGYSLSPEDLHDIGVSRMESLQDAMADVRDGLAFEGDQAAFHEQLREDPRFLADSPDEVEARYLSYVDEIEPLIPAYFSLLPEAPYGVKRADPATESGLTFGYFQPPKPPEEPRGLYRYNGSNLSERSLFWAKPLIFHELIPGHHFQIALQLENDALPPIRRLGGGMTMTAYREGWAEYAAQLGYEMGLYDDPYERYGRLAMEAFTVARIVVDTGMNALGWSLDDARAYMRDTTFSSETQIESETLRYSTDIPGQALAYAYGLIKLMEFRARAEDALGDDFDLRDYHAAVLSPGALPLNVLDQHLLAWQQEAR